MQLNDICNPLADHRHTTLQTHTGMLRRWFENYDGVLLSRITLTFKATVINKP